MPRCLIVNLLLFTLVSLTNTFCLAQFSPAQNWYSRNQPQFLWDNVDLMTELEVTRDQRREFIELKLDYEEATNQLRREVQKMQQNQYEMVGGTWKLKDGIQEKIKDSQKELNDLVSEYKERADDILLPHQKQMRSRSLLLKNFAGRKLEPLVGQRLKAHLKLSDQQQQRITEIARAANNEVAEKVLKMLEETERKVMQELNREQKEEYENLFRDWAYQLPKNQSKFWFYYYEAAFLKKGKD